MKLLYITNGINGSGGLERVLSIKASLLAEEYGYDVSILVLNEGSENPFYHFSPKINHYSINVGGNPLQYIKTYKNGVQAIVDKINPDFISVCDDGLKGFFIPHFLKTKSKIIYERHVSKLAETHANQSLFQRINIQVKWYFMGLLASKFDRFIVLTDGNKNEWKFLNNLEVVPNPLSFYPEESSDLDTKKVICVGKIAFQKGQDMLLKAWDIVHDRHPDWTLQLYGKENKDFLDTSLFPLKNVYWYPPAKDIEKKYLESSIYVMPSRFEGFGMVLTEAMACGVPCISFDCNYGPSDIIKDNEDGFVVEKNNVDIFAARIIELIENEPLRQSMGNSAKQNVMRYAPEVIVRKWDQLFKKI